MVMPKGDELRRCEVCNGSRTVLHEWQVRAEAEARCLATSLRRLLIQASKRSVVVVDHAVDFEFPLSPTVHPAYLTELLYDIEKVSVGGPATLWDNGTENTITECCGTGMQCQPPS